MRADDLGAEYKKLWGAAPQSEAVVKVVKYRDFGEAPDDNPEELAQFAAKVRRGQPKFRKNLLKLYDNRCAISGDGPEAVLEAAHIAKHSKTGLNPTSNGLLLRADLHSLFDAGLLKIDPATLRVALSDSLEGTSYWALKGQKLRERMDGKQPSVQLLKERWDDEA